MPQGLFTSSLSRSTYAYITTPYENNFHTVFASKQINDLSAAVQAAKAAEGDTGAIATIYGFMTQPENAEMYFDCFKEAKFEWPVTMKHIHGLFLVDCWTKLTNLAKLNLSRLLYYAIESRALGVENTLVLLLRSLHNGIENTDEASKCYDSCVDALFSQLYASRDWLKGLERVRVVPYILSLALPLLHKTWKHESTPKSITDFVLDEMHNVCVAQMGSELPLIIFQYSYPLQKAVDWSNDRYWTTLPTPIDLPKVVHPTLQRMLDDRAYTDSRFDDFVKEHLTGANAVIVLRMIIRHLATMKIRHSSAAQPDMNKITRSDELAFRFLYSCPNIISFDNFALLTLHDWLLFNAETTSITTLMFGYGLLSRCVEYDAIALGTVLFSKLMTYALTCCPKRAPKFKKAINDAIAALDAAHHAIHPLIILLRSQAGEAESEVIDAVLGQTEILPTAPTPPATPPIVTTQNHLPAPVHTQVSRSSSGGHTNDDTQTTPAIKKARMSEDVGKDVKQQSTPNSAAPSPLHIKALRSSSRDLSPAMSPHSTHSSCSNTTEQKKSKSERVLRHLQKKFDRHIPAVTREAPQVAEALRRLNQTQYGREKGNVKEHVLNLTNELIKYYDEEEEIDDCVRAVAECLAATFHSFLHSPQHCDTDKALFDEDEPFLTFFQSMQQQEIFVFILGYMRAIDDSRYIGILLLYYLLVFKKQSSIGGAGNDQDDGNEDIYTKYCIEAADNDSPTASLAEQLCDDVELLASVNPRLLALMAPTLMLKYAKKGPPKFYRMLCHHLTPLDISSMTSVIIQQPTAVLKKSVIGNIIDDSLEWESTAQLQLWQIIHATQPRYECMEKVLPKIISSRHPIAATNFVRMVQYDERDANAGLMRSLLSREFYENDPITIDTLTLCLSEALGKSCELISNIINKSLTPMKKSSQPPIVIDLILSHLDSFRRVTLGKNNGLTERFFADDNMQMTLNDAKNSPNLKEPEKFNEFFVIIEILGKSERTKSERSAKRTGQAKVAAMLAD